jgi:hypothetical protein
MQGCSVTNGLAMQHSPFFALGVAAAMGGPAFAAGIVGTPTHDPLLDSTPNGPCMAQAAGPDYAPGVDAQGYPVVPADVGAPPVAIPDQVIVPLPDGRMRQNHRGGRRGAHHQGWTDKGSNNANGPYAVIDGRRLEGLLNPPGCGAPPPPPPPPEPARNGR